MYEHFKWSVPVFRLTFVYLFVFNLIYPLKYSDNKANNTFPCSFFFSCFSTRASSQDNMFLQTTFERPHTIGGMTAARW